MSINLGDFLGSMRYGMRGLTLNGFRRIEISEFTAVGVDENDGVDLGRRGHAAGAQGHEGVVFCSGRWWTTQGRARLGGLAQYRYTPVTVNVGYEYGSVETFEYGANPEGYSLNGIPLTYMDYTRP